MAPTAIHDRPSVQDHLLVWDSKWKSGPMSNRNHGCEANTRGEEPERIYTRAPPEHAGRAFAHFPKNLSCKPATRPSPVPSLELSDDRAYLDLYNFAQTRTLQEDTVQRGPWMPAPQSAAFLDLTVTTSPYALCIKTLRERGITRVQV